MRDRRKKTKKYLKCCAHIRKITRETKAQNKNMGTSKNEFSDFIFLAFSLARFEIVYHSLSSVSVLSFAHDATLHINSIPFQSIYFSIFLVRLDVYIHFYDFEFNFLSVSFRCISYATCCMYVSRYSVTYAFVHFIYSLLDTFFQHPEKNRQKMSKPMKQEKHTREANGAIKMTACIKKIRNKCMKNNEMNILWTAKKIHTKRRMKHSWK